MNLKLPPPKDSPGPVMAKYGLCPEMFSHNPVHHQPVRLVTYGTSPAYLGLDDTDANDCPTGQTIIYTVRPAGFVEIEVTSAAKEWKNGKPNYGVIIWATNENEDGRDTRFYSKFYSDFTKHAYIQLNCN